MLPLVTTLRFEEIVAEKIRAAYQRLTVRDVYDLYQFRQRPFDRDLVRTLTVLKLWLVGDAFDLGTLDPDILRYVEVTRRFLVTDNRRSIPGHLKVHWAAGGHVWGIGWVRPQTTLGRLVEELCLIWGASEADEWLDRVEWLPL